MHYTSYTSGCSAAYSAHKDESRCGKAKLRLVHNVANGPDVDIILDGAIVVKNVPYMKISDYLEIGSGEHRLTVLVAGTDTPLIDANLDLSRDQAYTAIVHGDVKDLSSIAPLVLVDDLRCPKSGKAHVRFVHASALVPKAGIPAVDIYAGQNRVFSNVHYGEISVPSYLPVDAGVTPISVTGHDSTQVALGPINLCLRNGGIYTIIASGGAADAPLTALVSEDSKGSCVVTTF